MASVMAASARRADDTRGPRRRPCVLLIARRRSAAVATAGKIFHHPTQLAPRRGRPGVVPSERRGCPAARARKGHWVFIWDQRLSTAGRLNRAELPSRADGAAVQRRGSWCGPYVNSSRRPGSGLRFLSPKVGNRCLRWIFLSDSRDHVFEVGGTAPDDGPERAYRELLIAALYADEARIRGLLVPDERASVLWKRAYPAEVAAALAEQYRTMDVIRTPPPEDPRRVYLLSDGYPGPLAVVHDGSSWKVDATPLIESRTPERSE